MIYTKLSEEYLLNLQKEVDDGWIIKKDSFDEELSIYFYSRTTQYERRWNEYTLAARGMIISRDGYLIAKPFDKFFNIEEHDPSEIPNTSFDVFEKMDGSLGIVYYWEGEWKVATKGSFDSEQSNFAENLLKSKYGFGSLISGYTYLVEIIYPENRIVVDYDGMKDIVLLGAFDRFQKEVPYDSLKESSNIPIVKRYDGMKDFFSLSELNWFNHEGFVVRFKNGFRVKVKFADYVRLHKIITNVSSLDIWRALRDDVNFEELLKDVPDEFDEWVRNKEKELRDHFNEVKSGYIQEHERVISALSDGYTMKDFALKVNELKAPREVFAIENSKNIDRGIWNKIRPEFMKPFSNKNNSDVNE
jgi:hypothetical protein